MAAKIGNETVKSPGEVTLTCYAACTDITKTVTPDLKYPGKSHLLYIDMGCGRSRLGGTAFSTVYGQLGDEAPDVDDLLLLKRFCLFDLLRFQYLNYSNFKKGLISKKPPKSLALILQK
jgi:phosphoribosylformylglycinamidine (FGAM) synthase-like enzyme